MVGFTIPTAHRRVDAPAGGHQPPYLGIRAMGTGVDIGTSTADLATGEYCRIIQADIEYCIVL